MSGQWTVVSVVGTRPNLMKSAPVVAELARRAERFSSVLVHTGQHYDDEMSAIFLEELGLGEPDHLLGVGSGTHTQQVVRIMERLEPLLEEIRPELVVVPGDVNSTLGAALTAAILQLPIAHIEAGLRSFDPTMPEELNRVLVDAMAHVHLIHSPEARNNLLREGIPDDSIYYVGNTMIDTLAALRDRREVLEAPARYGLAQHSYIVATLHRPALVDGPLLKRAVAALASVARELPVLFPVHPRTRAALEELRPTEASELRLLPPLGYLEFLGLVAGAAAVVTDSGGIQEETTVLGVPCFTVRDTTERPVTVELGTNTVLGLEPERITEVPRLLRAARSASHQVPPLWDGHSAVRVVDVLERFLADRTADAVSRLSRSQLRASASTIA